MCGLHFGAPFRSPGSDGDRLERGRYLLFGDLIACADPVDVFGLGLQVRVGISSILLPAAIMTGPFETLEIVFILDIWSASSTMKEVSPERSDEWFAVDVSSPFSFAVHIFL